ncbi:MAG: hypothetical protein MUF20_04195 [Methylotetracoccus sp.]|jgi:hypothetical protein|nr:hypothetical protein [Methylotetracoccus sp.]
MRYRIHRLWILTGFAVTSISSADSALNYRLNGSEILQPVLVKEGRVLIPGLDAQDRRDFLFDRARGEAVVIDHKAQTFVTVNDQTIDRLSRQSEPLQPLIAGLGAQLGKLTPEQRAKWQSMLGGIDLDKVASAAKNNSAKRLTRRDGHRKVGAFDCDRVSVLSGRKKVAELCLSQAAALGLAAEDYATIRSLFDFAQHVAVKTKGFSSLMGWSIPVVSVEDIPGVPIEIRDLSGSSRADSLSLASIEPVVGNAGSMTIPEGYRREQLKLW